MEEDDDRDRAIYVERNKHQASAPLEGEKGEEGRRQRPTASSSVTEPLTAS